MMSRLLDLLASVSFIGLLYAAWLLWGRAARRVGVGRLQLLGLAALAAGLFG